jgi:predicted dehydrogenase
MEDGSTRRLRHAVIGAGAGILKAHLPSLLSQGVDLVAVTDVNEELGRRRAVELGCGFYADHREMLADQLPEVCVILAPQPFHARIAIDCLEAGSHVLVEKPMAVRLDDADAMIEAAGDAGRLLAVNFQQRFRPEVRAAKRLIESGELVGIQRVSMTHYWTRPAAYYEAAPWRAVPSIEGGGLLMNQASHDLDLLCYLLGMPERTVAWTDTVLHDVEVEDTVQAMLQWSGGAFGSLHTSTAGSGEEPNVVIYGTSGRLRVFEGRLEFERFEVDLKEYAATEPDPFGPPPDLEPVEVEAGPGGHLSVYQNLHQAILEGRQLMVDGVEGRKSLELANAMLYSNLIREEVSLPLDRGRYSSMVEELRTARKVISTQRTRKVR